MRNQNIKLLDISNPIECVIIRRVNRFVIEVEVEGASYRASTNNTGRLEQFVIPGKKAFCIRHQKPGRTDFRLFAIEDGDHAATNSGRPARGYRSR